MSRRLVLIGIISALAIGIIRLSFLSFTRSDTLAGCPNTSVSDGQIDPTQTVAFWQNQPVSPLTALNLPQPQPSEAVLGVNDNKWIEVDLSDQKLIAHDGGSIFLQTPVSTGTWGYRTPPGEYRIWYKVTATKMEGGNRAKGTYYYLPNVPFAMFFHNNYGIHGTYWHTNFGRPMSHGCVNTPTPIAQQLFYWTDPPLPADKRSVRTTPDNLGTRVIIHE